MCGLLFCETPYHEAINIAILTSTLSGCWSLHGVRKWLRNALISEEGWKRQEEDMNGGVKLTENCKSSDVSRSL